MHLRVQAVDAAAAQGNNKGSSRDNDPGVVASANGAFSVYCHWEPKGPRWVPCHAVVSKGSGSQSGSPGSRCCGSSSQAAALARPLAVAPPPFLNCCLWHHLLGVFFLLLHSFFVKHQ